MHFIRVGTVGVVYIVGVLSISVKLKISPVKLTIYSIVQLTGNFKIYQFSENNHGRSYYLLPRGRTV